jgi:hypothetical protein
MGAKIILFVLIAVVCSSLASALAETQIRFVSAVCDDSGNINAVFKQYEKGVDTTQLNLSAVHLQTGQQFEVKGEWYAWNEKVRFLTGKSDYPAIATFISTNNELTMGGNFTIEFAYYKTTSLFSLAKLKFAVECPGLKCFSDNMCREEEACVDSHCTYLNCDECHLPQFHTCDSKCDDHNPCTKDICSKGACTNEYVGGNCCVKDEQCNDKLICTTDYCQANKCYNDPVVCKKADDKCVFAVCGEPKGCVYQTDKSCLEKENERRKYLITVGDPEVVKVPFFTKLSDWLSGILGNFF